MKKSKIIMLTLLTISVLVLVLGGLVINRKFLYHYIEETALVNDFLITSEWKEIGNPDLLKSEKEILYIAILLEPPLEIDVKGNGIKSLDGSIVNPEIRLLDVKGNEYKLSFSGSRHFKDKNFANYRYRDDLRPEKRFSSVLIRSATPIQAKQILWSGYDVKDLP